MGRGFGQLSNGNLSEKRQSLLDFVQVGSSSSNGDPPSASPPPPSPPPPSPSLPSPSPPIPFPAPPVCQGNCTAIPGCDRCTPHEGSLVCIACCTEFGLDFNFQANTHKCIGMPVLLYTRLEF